MVVFCVKAQPTTMRNKNAFRYSAIFKQFYGNFDINKHKMRPQEFYQTIYIHLNSSGNV